MKINLQEATTKNWQRPMPQQAVNQQFYVMVTNQGVAVASVPFLGENLLLPINREHQR